MYHLVRNKFNKLFQISVEFIRALVFSEEGAPGKGTWRNDGTLTFSLNTSQLVASSPLHY